MKTITEIRARLAEQKGELRRLNNILNYNDSANGDEEIRWNPEMWEVMDILSGEILSLEWVLS